jgi:hypothetical protein
MPSAEADRYLGQAFRRLLREANQLRQVNVVLVGVDVFGNDPVIADETARKLFAEQYRAFPGVLNNASIGVDVIPVSNIGLGNTWEGLRGGAALRPYNVLEPLRRALPHYLPRPSFWRRVASRLFGRGEAVRAPASGLAHSVAPAVAPVRGRVFISYRRDRGAETARLIRKELEGCNWQVFLDVDDLPPSYFDERLLREIEASDRVVVILSPGALDRPPGTDDYLRKEIAHALSCGKPIVPILMDGFSFPPAEQLPADIRNLVRLTGVPYPHSFFKASMEKLARFLAEAR